MVLSKRRLSPYFLFALLLLLGWVGLKIVSVFLNYILLGLFLAYLTFPGYRWLLARMRFPPVAAIVMLVIITAVILVPSAFLAVELVDEVSGLAKELQGTDLEATVDAWAARFNGVLGRETTPDTQNTTLLDDLQDDLNQRAGQLIQDFVRAAATALVGVFVLLYVAYYAYTNGERFIDYLRDTLPMQEAIREHLMEEIGKVVRAVMYGSVLTALIQALLGGIGLWIFGVPNVVFWGVIMFILALLPVIGPPLVWGPWGVYLLLAGKTFEGIGLLVYSAILVSTIDNIIRPKLIGSQAHVHPVIVLLGVLGGLVVFGFSGFILGPLVLSIFVTILNVYRKEFALKLGDEEPFIMRD